MQASLRQSFHQMVVQPGLHPSAAPRSLGARPAPRRAAPGGPAAAPAPLPAHRWALAAVRADQAADATDTGVIQLISDISGAVDATHAATLARNAYAPGGPAPHDDTPLRSKVLASILDLQGGLLERETEVRLLLLAALCGEHLLLLGPPGTAKSELSRRLSKLTGGKYFERLLTRFSVPEELFGPLSMKGLENDLYVRQLEGYLPTAEVAFIDEIFKANSAILNALLTLLNERLFDNGSQRLEVPLLCLVGASNELPESEELDALYDRFLIRRQVAQVSAGQLATLARLAAGTLDAGAVLSTDAAAAANGAGGAAAGAEGELVLADFRGAAAAAYAAVDVPDAVIDVLVGCRNYLQDKCEPPVYVSDRRFMKAIKMLQVAAHADGRPAATEFDCLLLEFVLGQRPDDAQKVRAHVLETVASDPGLQQAELVFLGLFGRACRVLEAPTPQVSARARPRRQLPQLFGFLVFLLDFLFAFAQEVVAAMLMRRSPLRGCKSREASG
jgi:MoxR-like ATPase